MTKTLHPHSVKLVIDWLEIEDDAYPNVGLPLGISVFVELQVEPDSVFTVLKGVDGVIKTEATWYKGITKIADRAPKASAEDVKYQPSNSETERKDYPDTQGDLYSADDLDGGESNASSTKSSDTVRPSTITPKPSKIPIRKSGTDGALDDLDIELGLPPSPTLSSEDSLPWHSTKDTDKYPPDDEKGQTGIDLDELFTDLEDIYQPILRCENGDITLHAAREVEPGFYQVEIAFYRHFTRDTQGWYGVDLCDVVKTCPRIPGKLVFNIQDHPSLATHIVGPDDLRDMDDGSQEASFDPREEPYLAFWAWTHATYLEFWGEREVDMTYYDDLIAPNAYLDSDELVDYVEFMYKTRDEENNLDTAPVTIETPKKVVQSNHCMSPIAEEEEEEAKEADCVRNDQVDDVIPGDDLALNMDNVISGPEECPMTPIPEEEEYESEEEQDVVWEDVPIPVLGIFEGSPEEGSVSSSGEENGKNMVPEDVTAPFDVEDIALKSEEGSIAPFVEEEMVGSELEDATETNVKKLTSTFEKNSMMPMIEEKIENVVAEDSTPTNIEYIAPKSEESSELPTIKEEPEITTLEEVTTPDIDDLPPSPENNHLANDIEENNVKFSAPYHPPRSPTRPTYAEALEGYQKYHAMMAARLTFRCRALLLLQRFLPALFVFVFAICQCMKGPPVPISTPTNTLHTVKYYANHLGGMGYNALLNGNVEIAHLGQYQRGWFESRKEDEDFDVVEGDFLWESVGEPLERADPSDSATVIKAVESPIESVVWPSAPSLDTVMRPPPESAAEAWTPASPSTTPDLASDVPLPPSPEITSTLDYATSTPPPSETETAILSLAIKPHPLPRLCPECRHSPNTHYPSNWSPPPESALTILAGFAKDILRHVACSTSPICTISRISDKCEQPWDMFARLHCEGKGRWELGTERDEFDQFLGCVPDGCKLPG